MTTPQAPQEDKATPAEEKPPPVVLHSHCSNCYDIKCFVRLEKDVACDMIKCPRECGSRYHACKADDHMEICPNVHVSCNNKWFGCQVSKNRSGMKDHMQRCPANVVMCGEEMHRQDFQDHFCLEDHQRCEIQLDKWVKENRGETLNALVGKADPEVLEQFEAIYGTRAVLHEEMQADKNDNEVAECNTRKQVSDKEGNNNRPRYDDLHTVPWQSRPLLSSEVNEPESPTFDPSTPDDVDAAFYPIAEDDNESLSFESLPIIVLKDIARYLDGRSLGNLAVTSKHLRWVCAHLLQEKGMVEMMWEKREDSWQITKKIWHFGNMKVDD
ncbi:uncharacterized protein [Amphiura filiformis]|uniref:uncharacterized protein n=1 Tax=Amphiura filiformis TaxID=82378 RepID=UPI003B215E88